MKIGLAMTGGGARGAYQAGVLKRIGELKHFHDQASPFKIIGAASAGAVNAVSLAAGANSFRQTTNLMAKLWSEIKTEDIYRSDLKSLLPNAWKWVRDLSLGGVYGGGNAKSLLDAGPLQTFLKRSVRFERIGSHIEKGHLDALCIAATNYSSGKTFLFIQRKSGNDLWIKNRRIALDTTIGVDHVCASAAIPIVFGPVKLRTAYGVHYYGDGCLRMVTPLSPVIRLGADRVFAIGVRHRAKVEEQIDRRISDRDLADSEQGSPPLAQILGVTLNAIFLDHLETDIDHLTRLNGILSQIGHQVSIDSNIKEPMKIVTPLSISPSENIGDMAESFSSKMPSPLRYMMAGLGSPKTSSSDLVSYLLFDSSYTRALVDLGYRDATQRIDEIESFFADEKFRQVDEPAPA